MNLINNPYFNQDIINKIGLFGGTFNPLHNGHIELAKNSIVSLNLDAVVFVPNYLSPFKSDQLILDDFHRFKMIELTLKNYINFFVSDFEIKSKNISYTINTIKYFQSTFPKKKFVLLIGNDSLINFDKWFNFKEMLSLIEIGVFERDSSVYNNFNIKYKEIKGCKIDVSSSLIRDKIKHFLPINNLVPNEVLKYIKENKLYLNS